ncbi:MAG: hypothetical protein A4E66_00393 [Syntrophus sp. PtaB.Bin001]|jgi:hypothetical protein|nr:MAG: hypothetical protein A4E66_00393 [Syntrophus sp. PtaB.Bin001]
MIFRNRFRKFYQQFISLKGDPASLAWGMAMGVFIGVTPTIPFHTALIVVFGFLFKKNMASAYLGSLIISNPLTIPIFYFSEYQIGRLITGQNEAALKIEDYSFTSILQLGWDVAVPLLIGGVLLAAFIAVPSYFLTYRIICSLRKKTHEISQADYP